MINKINNSLPIKISSAVARKSDSTSIFSKSVGYETSFIISTSYVNGLQEPNYGSWGLGTGYVVDATGSRVFDESTFGSSLDQLTIVNRGPNNLRVSVNSTGFILSQALNLESDESIKINGPISSVWAASATGVAIVDGFGLPYINPNTI